ncbi:TDT family transporter [Streptomyces sp. SPB074]|uniref:TDT family transporter n=1 Tax=Streptomyces sp. (strain SPB074) TaxID=465543 RepID=UPI00017F126E|nr:TDT family transporter [Streptomyces sp. SPB074]EDY44704.1 C4-dicarboxylate transporter/malic acid transporter [Streptomyces sp. SPB074]
MSSPSVAVAPSPAAQTSAPAPVSRLRGFGPNHYAAVMGTAMLATAGSGLPQHVAGLRALCAALWGVAALALLAVLAARGAHWARHRDQARAHLRSPAEAPFYGCLAMAFLALSAATQRVGADVLGHGAATGLAEVLLAVGAVLAVAVAAGIPVLMIVHARARFADVSPVWLLPLVAPMVAASVGPGLAGELPAGQARETFVYGCLALFGTSLLAVLVVLPLVGARLLTGGGWPTRLAPSLFLVLGPLGQSTTATGAIADAARGVLPDGTARGLRVFSVVYGVPVMGFALLWLLIAAALVARALARGLRPSSTWWAFTFPVGTCVTGPTQLAAHTGLAAYRWLAAGIYVLLLLAWCAAAFGAVRELGARPAPAV